MHYGESRMICNICPSRNTISNALSNAQRVLRHLNQTTSKYSKDSVQKRIGQRIGQRYNWFNSHHSCRYAGNGCSEFQSKQRELQIIEQKLNDTMNILLSFINTLEDKERNSIRSQLFHLFRGHYPLAAQEINKIR